MRRRHAGIRNLVKLTSWIKPLPPGTMVCGKKLPEGDSTAPSAYVRDQDYYFEDGSIVVLAGDTLFKVRKLPISQHILLRTLFLRYIEHCLSATLHSSRHSCPFLKIATRSALRVILTRILSSALILQRIFVRYVGWYTPGPFFFLSDMPAS